MHQSAVETTDSRVPGQIPSWCEKFPSCITGWEKESKSIIQTVGMITAEIELLRWPFSSLITESICLVKIYKLCEQCMKLKRNKQKKITYFTPISTQEVCFATNTAYLDRIQKLFPAPHAVPYLAFILLPGAANHISLFWTTWLCWGLKILLRLIRVIHLENTSVKRVAHHKDVEWNKLLQRCFSPR